jgi:dTMP kinase
MDIKMNCKRGKFITFEGAEGSGKTTQAKRIYGEAKVKYPLVDFSREPGGTYTGEKIRDLLQHDEGAKLHSRTELLLFMASRAQHVEERIRPFVMKGGIFICDRFMDSSTAYQGYGRQLGVTDLNLLNNYAINSMLPDLTILIDTSVEIGFSRLAGRGGKKDKIEQEAIEFHERVRQGYLDIAKKNPLRFEIIDDSKNLGVEYIHSQVIAALDRRIGLKI